MKAISHICVAALALLIASSSRADDEQSTGPWDMRRLTLPRAVHWGKTVGDSQQLYFLGEPRNGRPTRVFGYFARPKGAQIDLPAMLLLHGGGGTAVAEWAEIWAGRGYAALAVDLAGYGPDGKRLRDGGPDQEDLTKFEGIREGVEATWSYHAVASCIQAISVLRSFDDIDPNRIGITGISWGGYLTCIVAGLDNRIKVAVPVYGCGFIHEDSEWLDDLERLPPEFRAQWISHFDPSKYLSSCRMPMLFVTGTNDYPYRFPSHQKSFGLVKSPKTLSVHPDMIHGFREGFARPEIGLFVDSILRDGAKLAEIEPISEAGNTLTARFLSRVPIESATLHYTTDEGPWYKRKWEKIPATLSKNKVEATLPVDKGIVYFLSITDERGAVVSTEHHAREAETPATEATTPAPSE